MTVAPPNLFSFATGELSQDAILAWLISWADRAYAESHPALHKTGNYFIRKAFEKRNTGHHTWNQLPEIKRVLIEPQKYKIDLLIGLQCADGIHRVILLEDKVHTGEHNGQLKRYLDKITKTGFPREAILPVFLKTGFQHDWSAAQTAGYREFTAKDLLDVWEFGASLKIENAIFSDFGHYLRKLADDFDQAEYAFGHFDDVPISTWKYWHWLGFFVKMKPLLSCAGFANNQFRRDRMLSFWFGCPQFEFDFDGQAIKYGPNFDLAIVNDTPSLSVRLWIQHLTEKGIDFRPLRDALIPKLEALGLGRPGQFKNAKDSILMMKLDLNTSDMTARQLENHLQTLQTQLQKITSAETSI